MESTLFRLESVIAERRSGNAEASYVAKLSAKGRGAIAQKVGEEASEVIIAAMGSDPQAVTSESADLVFHLAVLLADCGLSFDDVFAELDRREGVSGLTEKASRKDD